MCVCDVYVRARAADESKAEVRPAELAARRSFSFLLDLILGRAVPLGAGLVFRATKKQTSPV